MDDKFPRTYEVKVQGQGKYLSSLDKTQELYHKGCNFFENLWLNLTGCMRPELVLHTTRNSYTPGTKKSQKKTKSEGEFSVAIHCFNCWFSLESADLAPVAFIVSADQIPALFASYWKQTCNFPINDPALKIIFDSLNDFSKNEKAVWVDRFAAGKAMFGNMEVDSLLKEPNYPIKQDGDQAACRTLISQYWGEGVKADWSEEYDSLAALQGVIADIVEFKETVTPRQVIDRYIRKIEASESDTVNAESFVKSLRKGKTGRYNSRDLFIFEYFNNTNGVIFRNGKSIDFADILKSFNNKLIEDVNKAKRRNNTVSPTWALLKEMALKSIGVPFHQEHYSMMADLSVRRIRVMTKLFYNKLETRLKLTEELKELESKPVTNSWLKNTLTTYKNLKKQEYFNGRQWNGLNELLHTWVKTPNDLVGAVKTAQVIVFDRFGDASLFIAIAQDAIKNKFFANKANCDTLKEEIRLLCDIDDMKDTLKYLRWDVLRHISKESPELCSYGKSKPTMYMEELPINKAARFWDVEDNRATPFKPKGERTDEDYAPHHHISLSLFNGVSFESTQLPFYGIRFMREIMCEFPEQPVAFRNNSLFRLKHGTTVNPVKDKSRVMACSPYKKGDDWYIRVQVSYSSKRTEWKKLQDDPSLKVMSVDLGQRKAGYYSILQKTQFSKLIAQGENSRHAFNIVDHNSLEDLIRASDTNDFIDMLEGFATPTTADIAELWKKWCNGDMPEFFIDSALDVSYKLKAYVRGMAVSGELIDHRDLLKYADAILGCKTNLDTMSRTTLVRGQGGLSFKRIDKINNVVKALSAYAGILQDDKNGKVKQEVPTVLIDYIAKLRVKLLNCKKERIRRTVSSILKVALESQVDMIVVEDLNIEKQSHYTKRNNRRTADWCPKRVIEHLRQECGFVGIFLKAVDPYDTSTIDWTTGEFRTRYKFVQPEAYNSNYWYRYYNGLAAKEGMGYKNRQITCLEAWKQFMVSNNLTPEKLKTWVPTDAMYVPYVGAEYFYNSALGTYIDSDFNASINIGMRGIQLFFGYKPQKNFNSKAGKALTSKPRKTTARSA